MTNPKLEKLKSLFGEPIARYPNGMIWTVEDYSLCLLTGEKESRFFNSAYFYRTEPATWSSPGDVMINLQDQNLIEAIAFNLDLFNG